MKPYRPAVMTVVLLALVVLAARAADLPVSYTVAEKALKAAVAGTNVTFDLYTDNACTSPLAHTETVAIENVDVISRLKLFKPKNSLVVLPKTDELRHTLTGVTVGGNVFLKVTGIGITPVGPSCQPQVGQSAPHGPLVAGILHFDDDIATFKILSGGSEYNRTIDGFHLFTADRLAAGKLAALDPAYEYRCTMELGPWTAGGFRQNAIVAAPYIYIAVFDIDDCTTLPLHCGDNVKNSDEVGVAAVVRAGPALLGARAILPPIAGASVCPRLPVAAALFLHRCASCHTASMG